MKTKTNKARYVASAALIAALYVVLTTISSLMGLSSGVIQVRFSEALTILPAFTPAAIPGLFIGCLISNIIAGGVIWDVIFGSVATLIGAVGTYLLKRKKMAGPTASDTREHGDCSSHPYLCLRSSRQLLVYTDNGRRGRNNLLRNSRHDTVFRDKQIRQRYI